MTDRDRAGTLTQMDNPEVNPGGRVKASGRIEVTSQEQSDGSWIASYPELNLSASGDSDAGARAALVLLVKSPAGRERMVAFYRRLAEENK